MNFLAHAIFADGPDEIVFGAMMADLLKRRSEESPLSQGIIDGMQLHAYLDRAFDNVKSLAVCRTHLRSIVRSYHDPIIDIFADHVIASKWEDIFENNFNDYILQLHNEVLVPRMLLFPEKWRTFAEKMTGGNLILSYKSKESYKSALQRLARRSKKGNLITDNIDAIMEITFDSESRIRNALPEIRTLTKRQLYSCGYQPEMRLHWISPSSQESFGFTNSGERK